MQAYKTVTTIQKKQRLVLENVPFRAGQEVEVVVLTKQPAKNQVAELRALFSETQVLPQIQTISEEEIAAEIAAYRASQ